VESTKVVMTEMDKYPIGMSMDGVWMNDRTVNDKPFQYYEGTANYGLQGSKVGIKLKICKCLVETKKSGIKLQIFP
jgi:hypothetical protein